MNFFESNTLNPSNIDQLQGYVDRLIRLLARTNPVVKEYEMIELIQGIGMVTFGRYFPTDQLSKIIVALEAVYKISNNPVTLFESDGKKQYPIESSLSQMLLRTLDCNYHTIRGPCKSYNESTQQCSLNNPLVPGSKDHIFKCDFHMYDSLSIHLVLACLYNTLWAIDKDYNDQTIMMVCLLGLYHDIGKPSSLEMYEFKNSVITGFPAHGEIGEMIFKAHWSESMVPYITKDEYMVVSTSILRHMCGYHGNSRERANKYKRHLLLIEHLIVRKLLTTNRVGDHYGKLTSIQAEASDESFLKEQEIFEEQMSLSVPFNLTDCLTRYSNKHGSIDPTKVVVYVIGTSGAGKSYFTKEFVKRYPLSTVVSRDETIAEVCVGMRVRLEGNDYVNMYKIYEAGKGLETLMNRNSKSKSNSKNILQGQAALIKAKKEWNQYVEETKKEYPILAETADTNIQSQVRDLYEGRILLGLQDPNRFIVLDTFMNCFPMGVEANVPKILTKHFRVHVHVQSFLECTSTSICSTIEAQLKVSGPHSIESPIHPEGFKNGKKLFASLSAEIGSEGDLPKSVFSSKFRPHLVAGSCIRTLEGTMGYDEVFSCFDKLQS